MSSSVRRVVLGSPLPTSAEVYQRLNRIRALAVFSSDALSSVAYATEEILAGKTLIAMGGLLATIFLGISLLARLFGLSPVGDQTVLSMMGRRVFGGGPLYPLLQFATMLILVLVANTSFADFPRQAAILARDQYLPEQLTN